MSNEAMKLEKIMEQAQVFASAWSLVGGRFDNGNMLDEAEAAEKELRQMVADALAKQPAPVQQEPVAWCVINNGEIIGEPTLYRDGAEEILEGQIEGCGSEIAPLYTSPQPAQRICAKYSATPQPPAQRTWVGLTDEERQACINYRAVEAKLKEKNT